MSLTISFAPERLEEGSPEERGTFGLFSIEAGEARLTEGFDTFINAPRRGPLVPAFHAAQWFAWNWWRLRWEPRTNREMWAFAHNMATIGEGYVWPELVIRTDGLRTVLQARPSRADAKPFRYTPAWPVVMPAREFEAALDIFIPQVIERLRSEGVEETNLDRLWRDVLIERRTPEAARRRKLEALLGLEPDSAEDATIAALERDVLILGEPAVEEIAAGGVALSSGDLRQQARDVGFVTKIDDAVRLSEKRLPLDPTVPAWRVGRDAARKVRATASVREGMIENARLAELVGIDPRALASRKTTSQLSFSLRLSGRVDKTALRSPILENRRFDVARILGDRIVFGDGHLLLATRAYTYRQKVQRAFAAELLSPSHSVEQMLVDDDTPDRQQEIARSFGVSEYVIMSMADRMRLEDEGADDAAAEDLAA